MGGFYSPDQFTFEVDPMPSAAGASVLGVFFVVYFLVMLATMALSMASYVLHSLGLYTIASRRGIRNSWLAWIPLGNLWILGNISDQYQYIVKGKVKNRRKLLLGLTIGAVVVCFFLMGTFVLGLFLTEGVGGEIATGILLIVLSAILIAAVSITLVILEYMCLYDLFRSCEPSNAVLYLLLSIFFTVMMPIFVFLCRKKDLGMPPRKQPAPQQVVVPTVEPIVDPTVVEEVVIPTVEPIVDPTVVEKVVIPTVEPVVEEGFAQPEEFEDE